jgi:6-phosphogluconolactonase
VIGGIGKRLRSLTKTQVDPRRRRGRRRFCSDAAGAFASLAVTQTIPRFAFAQAADPEAIAGFAYVGCYTTPSRDGAGRGINVYRIDSRTGIWSHVQLVTDIDNPSFLVLDHTERFLYSVHGDMSYASAFAVDSATGELRSLNRREVGGSNPVHLAVDPSNRFLVVSNYGSGSLAVLPLERDGSLGALRQTVELPGEPGPHEAQTGSLPHHNPFDPQGRFVVVPDKGLDKVFVFELDARRGMLRPAASPQVALQPGAGPRHVAFHRSLPYAYVNNELDSTVAVFAYDAATGALEQQQLLSTLPGDFEGANTTAEIAVHASGRFVFVSNRGHDSIVRYGVDADVGLLRTLGWTPTRGTRPRYFGIDPTGALLYACNQDTHTIVAFRIDETTGALLPTNQVIETGSPVTIAFSRG